MTYHVAREGETLGEFTEAEFREKNFANEVSPNDWYWTEGMSDWRSVSEWRAIAPVVEERKIEKVWDDTEVVPPVKQRREPNALDRVCTNCGYIGRPVLVTKGSLANELVIWVVCVFFAVVFSAWLILPAIGYSVWRLASRYRACPQCEAQNMIPSTAPAARKFLEQS